VQLTVRVGYNTPMSSNTNDNLCAVFKAIVEEFSSDEEEYVDSFHEKGKHFFYKGKMHNVIHYDDGETVKFAPSLRHAEYFRLPQTTYRALIAEYFDKFVWVTEW
jgi:hypothetical protein